MGRPCYVIDEAGKKRVGPPCTDNFQVRKFIYDGVEYYSCEHAYQALKFIAGSRQLAMNALHPNVGESDSAFGMRCWSEGQRGQIRDDWDLIKVGVMFAVNEAKYAQHADLQKELLSTGLAKIVGAPSTSWTLGGQFHNWNRWNGLIQMRIREQLRSESDRVPGVLSSIISEFDAYSAAASVAK